MALTLDIREVPSRIDEMIGLVKAGVEVVLTVDDTTSARLVPSARRRPRRKAGLHPGEMRMAEGFDDPLPEAFWLSGS